MIRKIDYLRLSVSDRCNLNCLYCIPSSGISCSNSQNILTFDEIEKVVKCFVKLGIKKIRLTGGEPLLRENLVDLVRKLKKIDKIREICLTTNGIMLANMIQDLKKAGLSRVNISLDSLKEEKFLKITGKESLSKVLNTIEKLKEAGFNDTKVNVVILKSINDDEILDFVNFAIEKNLTLRFIEFMKVTPLWNKQLFFPIERIKQICSYEFNMKKIPADDSSPAEYYSTSGINLGFIKTSLDNCSRCSRLRLTSSGILKSCLYEVPGFNLKNIIRDKHYDEKRICALLNDIINKKFNINYQCWNNFQVYMSTVGG